MEITLSFIYFQNYKAHPTLTPNPTFQPQSHPLTLTTMTQQQKQSTNPNSNSNNPNNISPLPPSQHPSLHTPMQFIPPPPHTYHELQPPPHTHTIHPGNGPFGSNIDDRKHTNNKLSYYGVMPSPFMPQHTSNHNNGLSYSSAIPQHEHDNDTHKNDNSNPTNHNGVGQRLMISPQQIPNVNVAPMFGHPAYLPNDAYLRRVKFTFTHIHSVQG